MASSGRLILYVLLVLESTLASSFASRLRRDLMRESWSTPRGGTLLLRDLRIAWFCTPCLITLDIWFGLLKDLMMASSGMFELLRDLIIASSGIPPKLLFVRPINPVDRCAPSTFSRLPSFSTFSTFLLQSKTFS